MPLGSAACAAPVHYAIGNAVVGLVSTKTFQDFRVRLRLTRTQLSYGLTSSG